MDYYPAFKKWDYKTCRQIDEAGNSHSEWDNWDPKREIMHAFFYM